MASIDTTKTYVFTNTYTTGTKYLQASDSSASATLSMVDSSNPPSSLAEWYITSTNTSPYYRLHTVAGGDGLSLDVLNNNGTNSVGLLMATTGSYSGQYWRFDNWPGSDSGGGYRLSNGFTGLDKHLDVYGDTYVAHLSDGDFTGQHWTLSALPGSATPAPASSSSSSSSSSPVSVSVSTATTTATVAAAAANSNDNEPHSGSAETLAGFNAGSSSTPSSSAVGANDQHAAHNGLSTGATVGIAIAAVAIIGVLIGLLVFFLLRRRKREGYNRPGGNGGGYGDNSTAYGGATSKPEFVQETAQVMSPPPQYDTHGAAYGAAGYQQQYQQQPQQGMGVYDTPQELPSSPAGPRVELPA